MSLSASAFPSATSALVPGGTDVTAMTWGNRAWPWSEARVPRAPSGTRTPHALRRVLSCRWLSGSGGASSGAPHVDHGREEATSCLGPRATSDSHEPGDLEQTTHPTPS